MKYLLVPAGLLGLATLLGCAKSSRVAIESDALVAAQPQAELDAKSEPAPPVVTEAGTFSFAEDAAGKLLAKTLIPAEPRHLPPDPVAKPRAWAGLAAVERPELPLAQPALPLPSIPFAKRPPLRPQGLADSMPLDFFRAELVPPQRPELPPAVLLRQAAPDVREPVPLAVQTKPVGDRASLEDPTGEFSSARVISEPARMRLTPAPFQRYNLPEPFENRVGSGLPPSEPPVVAPVPTPPK